MTTSKSLRRGSTRGAGGARDLGVGRVGQHRAVREDDQRAASSRRRPRRAARGPSRSPRGRRRAGSRSAGARRAARTRGRTRSRRPRGRCADVGRAAVRPLEQEARDRRVEELVGRPRRPQHVVVDAPVRHRVEDRVARGRVAPLAPLDQEPALGARVQVMHSVSSSSPWMPSSTAPTRAPGRPPHRRPPRGSSVASASPDDAVADHARSSARSLSVSSRLDDLERLGDRLRPRQTGPGMRVALTLVRRYS